ncbi:MAG: S8 family peptidase [Chitinophagaceae bacterium]
MKKIILASILFMLICLDIEAQFSRYIIWLKDKGSNTFSLSTPSAYLSSRALERRTRYGISIDSSDLPVSPSYVATLSAIPSVTILNVSKWLNAVCIEVSNPSAINTIQSLPFVQNTGGLANRNLVNGKNPLEKFKHTEEVLPLPLENLKIEGISGDYYNYGNSALQEMKLHKGEFLHNIGLRGQEMQIAVLDGGFYNYHIYSALDSVNRNGQILHTWDFVARQSSVAEDHPHGMQCLSTIAANIPGQFVGKAPKASFYLYRTEDVNSEYPIEEFNWVCGAERADSSGADVISSSLGYFDFDNPVFNYVYRQMDGNSTIAVKGADRAAQKGLLVFNSAGNEGNSNWRQIITPSDGDSVVAVGAVSAAGTIASFSSYGPSGDGRIKPDVASVGLSAVVQSGSGTIGVANGTSFACPNMAGLGTCLWQGFPEFNNMKVIEALKRSAHKFNTPDDRVGYGIPNLKNAFAYLLAEYATANATLSNCQANLTWKSKDVEGMQYLIERKLPNETDYTIIRTLQATNGNTLANQNYNYTDSIASSTGIITYRITQVIDTNAASRQQVYLDSVQVNLTSPCIIVSPEKWIRLFPNPLEGSEVLHVSINTPTASTSIFINVFDANGKLLLQQRHSKPVGATTLNLPSLHWPSGNYFITVREEESVIATVPLIKAN